jgi:hypothetical protein
MLLHDYGVFSVHLVGLPPGISAILIKFIPFEIPRGFAVAERFAQAVDCSTHRLTEVIRSGGVPRTALRRRRRGRGGIDGVSRLHIRSSPVEGWARRCRGEGELR